MAVFIANFGKGNYLWDACRERPSIATMNDQCCHPYWLADDKEGYILHAGEAHRTANGNPAPRPTASLWFNLMTRIQSSTDDIWIHRSGDDLWWTTTNHEPAEIDDQPHFEDATGRHVFYCHKPCEAWSSKTRQGLLLTWSGLHPKARDFLSTEATLQRLHGDYADYAIALVSGEDLSPWHSTKLWSDKEAATKTKSVRHLVGRELAAHGMAITARETAKAADGRTVERTTKTKDWRFRDDGHAVQFILQLMEDNDHRCALTGLPLQFPDSCDDKQMLVSLDRIDSEGHYEPGNVQVVCRFANFWKSAQPNDEFLRLMDIVQNSADT